MPAGFLDKLERRMRRTVSALCLGIDPDPDALPPGFSSDVAGIERFAALLLEACAPVASAVKPNLAFFEAFGSPGIAALERILRAVPSDLPVILDAKRADVQNTAQRQAVALLETLGADAVTLNPYLGREAVDPFLERTECFAYVLCRTSNPGAGEFQDLPVGDTGDPLYLHVARTVTKWAGELPKLGLVVGATSLAELEAIRTAVPTLPFLVPGVGTQGGDPAGVLASGGATEGPAAGLPGGGVLVNVSRSIAAAALTGGDPGRALARTASDWSRALAVLA